MDNTFNANLRRIRKEKGITQEQMLEAARTCTGMREIRQYFGGGAKRTAAHSYDAHNTPDSDVFTDIDELEDA